MLMWKILFYVVLFYIGVSLLDKIVRKVKARKYGRNIDNRSDNGNNGSDDNRAGDVGTDKQ